MDAARLGCSLHFSNCTPCNPHRLKHNENKLQLALNLQQIPSNLEAMPTEIKEVDEPKPAVKKKKMEQTQEPGPEKKKARSIRTPEEKAVMESLPELQRYYVAHLHNSTQT